MEWYSYVLQLLQYDLAGYKTSPTMYEELILSQELPQPNDG